MAIRFKKYKFTVGGKHIFRAVRITEKNYLEIVNYVNRNGGQAEGSVFITKDGDELNHKIRVRQRNYGENWGKRDWRVARVGDFIVRYDFDADLQARGFEPVEFARVKEDEFEASAVEVK